MINRDDYELRIAWLRARIIFYKALIDDPIFNEQRKKHFKQQLKKAERKIIYYQNKLNKS